MKALVVIGMVGNFLVAQSYGVGAMAAMLSAFLLGFVAAKLWRARPPEPPPTPPPVPPF